jgi:hypothetical protein
MSVNALHTGRYLVETNNLEAKDTILFEGDGLSWEEILGQVVRLGFGECYVASVTLSKGAGHARINLQPKSAHQSFRSTRTQDI